MKITPKYAYMHANCPANTALSTTGVYEATQATNLPNWEKEGKIFVQPPNGAPELLLLKGEYTIVD